MILNNNFMRFPLKWAIFVNRNIDKDMKIWTLTLRYEFLITVDIDK